MTSNTDKTREGLTFVQAIAALVEAHAADPQSKARMVRVPGAAAGRGGGPGYTLFEGRLVTPHALIKLSTVEELEAEADKFDIVAEQATGWLVLGAVLTPSDTLAGDWTLIHEPYEEEVGRA